MKGENEEPVVNVKVNCVIACCESRAEEAIDAVDLSKEPPKEIEGLLSDDEDKCESNAQDNESTKL